MTGPPRLLSIIVGLSSDTNARVACANHLAECLVALAAQVDAPPLEVIVPHQEPVLGLDEVKKRFPWVRFLSAPDVVKRVGGREHHDVLKARAIAASTGDLIGLLEDHELPDERWAASVVAAHRSGPRRHRRRDRERHRPARSTGPSITATSAAIRIRSRQARRRSPPMPTSPTSVPTLERCDPVWEERLSRGRRSTTR